MVFFNYTEEETEYLKNKDPILGAAIDKIGLVKRRVEPDTFSALISSIISQQISTKAAITVKKKLIDLIDDITPQSLYDIDLESIQKCGMSFRKASYIKEIANASVNNEVDFENLYKFSDKEIINILTKLKGVGEWTVEMLLIHSLQRPDVLSYKDLAIRRGIMRLYDLEDLSKKEFEIYRNRYSPYNSVASLYIWEISAQP